MSINRPRGSKSKVTQVALDAHRRDRDRPIREGDLKALRRLLREERKARADRERKALKRGPGSNAARSKRELAERPQLPLNERQQDLLCLLTDEPERPKLLGEVMELTNSQMQSAMSSLVARGLAIKVPGKGWKRA